MAAARALAELAREDVVEEVERAYGKRALHASGPEYLLPKPIDPRILVRESAAVARQAIEEGVARRPLESEGVPGEPHRPPRHRPGDAARHDPERPAAQAARRLLRGHERDDPARVQHPRWRRASRRPILLGRESEVREAIERLGLGLGGVQIVEPAREPALRGLRRRVLPHAPPPRRDARRRRAAPAPDRHSSPP